MVSYDANVLLDAVALRLLEKQQMNVNGKPGWEWYVLRTPKKGEWAILLDGTRKQIEDIEQGITC
jgi:NAD(P)H-hydrate repair Nnr-like enzyme with NAD(P)H-hydrate dehydratase domain